MARETDWVDTGKDERNRAYRGWKIGGEMKIGCTEEGKYV
jgi:hypothetical protein